MSIYGSGLPGAKYTSPRMALAQQLMASGSNTGPIQSWTQGANRMVQMLLGAKMRNKEVEDRNAATQAMLKGMSAKPWTDPDNPSIEYGPAGGYEGGLKALEGVPGYHAGRLTQDLLMRKMDRQADIEDQERKTEAAKALEIWKRDNLPTTVAPGASVYQGGELQVTAPAKPKTIVPGRDTPYSPEVYQQLVDIAGAKAAASQPTWTVDPQNPNVQQSSTGERKPAPSTRPPLTKGQEATDSAFSKEYVEFVAMGGFADAEKNLAQLRGVREELKTNPNLTGPVVGRDPLRDVWNPASIDAQERVEEVVQRNLRIILGAQFTEKEGTRLIARAYNPKLQEPENGRRLDRLIAAMEAALDAKKQAADYWEANGTMAGFKGASRISISDLEKAIDEPAENREPLPEGVTEDDVKYTMRKHGLTREEVLRRMSGRR